MANNEQNGTGGCLTSIFGLLVMVIFIAGMFKSNSSSNSDYTSDIDAIVTAKQYVIQQLNYPDTADFHDLETKVTSTHVHLKVTAKNGFGVPSTHTFDVPRSK